MTDSPQASARRLITEVVSPLLDEVARLCEQAQPEPNYADDIRRATNVGPRRPLTLTAEDWETPASSWRRPALAFTRSWPTHEQHSENVIAPGVCLRCQMDEAYRMLRDWEATGVHA